VDARDEPEHDEMGEELMRAPGFGVCCVILLLAWATTARAADPAEIARIANYAGADRQPLLETGARAEGGLVIYTVGAQIDPVVKAFNAKYPFLTVRVVKKDPPELVKQVGQEYKAGIYTVDAYELDDFGLRPLLEAGLLAPFASPETAHYPAEAIEAGKHWVMMRQDFISLGFNTDALKPEDAPRSHQDLLDPKWKGRMGISASVSTIVTWVGALAVAEGEAFVRKLGPQTMRLYPLGGRAVSNLIVSGEVPIVVNNRRSHMYASARDGAHVAWRALGPSYTSVSGAALATHAKNPHAAMLFVDFLLGSQAQAIYTKDLGYASMRDDLQSSDAPSQKLYLTLRPDFYREYEQWNDLSDEVFRAAR
jgi:iron(III) transport system substrate-binding protein